MQYSDLADLIAGSENIVFFGGAGVSTESGIPDFRSENGIFKAKTKYGYSPEELLSHSFFIRHPDIFYDYYVNMMIYKDAEPNAAHIALAKLEGLGKLKAVITQNIDGLHQKAGSRNVLELHGSVHLNHCMECGKFHDLEYVLSANGVPRCECGGLVKPDVVLYEEPLDYGVMQSAVDFISKADILIVAGTSLSVYPAAGLITYYKGGKLVLINKSPTQYDSNADMLICGSVGEVLSKAVSAI